MDTEPQILVVDDEDANVDMLSRRLRRAGYGVTTASSGKEALAAMAQRTFDLVLLDHMMPGMSGSEVLQVIRSTEQKLKTPVIMVTAIHDSKSIVTALQSGADDYITKPLDFQVALARIETQISRHTERTKSVEREERYALAAHSIGSGVWDWNLKTNFVYCSAVLCQLIGEPAQETYFKAMELASCVHPDDLDSFCATFRAGEFPAGTQNPASQETPEEAFSAEFRIQRPNRIHRWVHLEGITHFDTAGTPIRRLGSVTDVTEQKLIDPGTGLLNRLGLQEQLTDRLNRTNCSDGAVSTLLVFQINQFAELMLAIPPAHLEEFAAQVVSRFKDSLASHPSAKQTTKDLLARLKENQFAVIIDHTDGDQSPEFMAKGFADSMKVPLVAGGRRLFLSLSFGCTNITRQMKDAATILRCASTAMAHGETREDQCLVYFDSSMQETRERRLQLEEDMHTALEKNEFQVLYQPRVELETSRICGFEALVRWNHPVSGLVSPLEFIPIAESNGFICELGEWILQQACTQTQLWISQFDLEPEFEISVNLSVRQCRQPDLAKQIVSALKLSGLDAKHLKLEITESLFLGDFTVAKGVLEKLKALGLGLKLDDFGTGYSCFQYLCDLPFDSLKIDRAFVRRLDDGTSQATEIVRSVVNIGHSLSMEVIAEGIENKEQAEQLSAVGCQFGQGFLYSKPVNASVAEEMLRQQTLLQGKKQSIVRAA